MRLKDGGLKVKGLKGGGEGFRDWRVQRMKVKTKLKPVNRHN